MNIRKFRRSRVLDEEGNVIFRAEIDFDEDKKVVVNYCILLILQKGQQIHIVVKYDAAHGSNHVHKYYERLDAPAEEVLPTDVSSKAALVFKKDIMENWKQYVERYSRKWLR
jgi:hypothetical protein